MTTSYAPVPGLRMYYEEHGTGRPLVLLHGGGHTLDLTFGEVLPDLARTHRVIAPELDGHGRTASSDRALSLEILAEDVVALLDHLGIEQADFFGFSLGGLVSLQLAITHPERVGRMVLGSAHYRPDGYYDEITNYQNYPDSTRMPTQADFQEMQEAYAKVAPSPGEFEHSLGRTSAMVAAFTGWSADDLRAVRSRTLILLGDHDFMRLEHAVEMHDLIPDAQLAVLPGTTHTGVMRRPDLILPMVTTFLART